MKKDSPAYILGFMLIIAVVFGTGVAVVHYSTQDMLQRNERLHRNRVLTQAFELDAEDDSPQAYEQAVEENLKLRTIEELGREWEIFTRSRDGNDVGFIFTGLGFWDRIIGVIVLTPDLQQVVNLQILEQSETPGLGARITQPWFTEQFKGLEIAWDQPINQRIIIGPAPQPNAVNQVDAITGASQTSIALMNILNRELEGFREVYTENFSSADKPISPSASNEKRKRAHNG
ncbi:MAG: FMN-binding protein [Chitinivibrionales bacterium]